MTTSIKSLFLLSGISFFVACSTSNNQESPNAPKSDSSKTINGNVQSIEFGKDGYTADVATKEEGVYAALVSMVNLGGPENYQQVNVGDKVTFEGVPNYSGNQPSLKVEKIINVAPSRTQLLISPVSFRGIQVGDLIANHSDYLEKKQLSNGEGTFTVFEIKDFNNNPAGYLLPDPNDELLVGDITVETQMAQTATNIKVGSTFGDLQKVFPNIEVHGSEIEGRTYANANNLAYRLEVPNFTYEVDKATIPTTTKITQIVIHRGPKAESYILYEQYQKTSSVAYCWQTNKVLNLYTKPNTNSVVQGKHFQGEVLSVLDSRIIDEVLWVNVTYKLSIKTGYEDQFADATVHSSGVPTGWIGGTAIPRINCK